MARRQWIVMFVRNAVLGALVFLPLFLVLVPLEMAVLGVQLEGGLEPHLLHWLFLYGVFLLPVAVGTALHSAGVLLLSALVPVARPMLLAIVCSPLLPATLLVIGGIDGASVMDHLIATTLATLAYGVSSGLLQKQRFRERAPMT